MKKKKFIFKNLNNLLVVMIFLYGMIYLPDIIHWFKNFQISHLKIDLFFQTIILAIVGYKVLNFLRQIISKKILIKTQLDKGTLYSLNQIMFYIILIVVTWISLSILGINTQNLAILFGALSVGIGFGLQHIINNFVSGLLLLFERPIKPGDCILIKGVEGTIKNIHIRSTEIISADGSTILIPNSDILSNVLIKKNLD